mgnify:CR=1 FL=1|tara:strand:+ start:139 stop:690 length:552 start_codon:yes stop_codon:yes gene_type:complete
MKALIFIFILFYSGFSYSAETKEVNLSCDCRDAEYKNFNEPFYTQSSCEGLSDSITDQFTIKLIYELDLKGQKKYLRASSSITGFMPGVVYLDSDHKIVFDFLNIWYWKEYKRYHYDLRRITINKYNLDFTIDKYSAEPSDEQISVVFNKNSNDYYLIKIFKDKDDRTKSRSSGGCLISEKKL